MDDTYKVQCACGRAFVVSSFAFGMTSRCACGAELLVTAANASRYTESVDEKRKSVAGGPVPVDEAGRPTVCARCRKPFKGAWDRVTLPDRVLCYVCGNQWEDGVPVRVRSVEFAAHPDDRWNVPVEESTLNRDAYVDTSPSYFMGMPVDSPAFRKGLYVLAGLMVFATVGIIYLDLRGEISIDGTTDLFDGKGPTGGELTAGSVWLLRIAGVSSMWLAGTVALFLTMHVWETLPRDELGYDLSYAGLWAALFTGVATGALALASVLPLPPLLMLGGAAIVIFGLTMTVCHFTFEASCYAALVYASTYLILSGVVSGVAQSISFGLSE